MANNRRITNTICKLCENIVLR